MTLSPDQNTNNEKTLLIYDGECPFCSEYVKLVRLRDAIGPVELINARDQLPVVNEIINAGFDLDEGMVLRFNGNVYHGADCINMLALMSTSQGVFNRFNNIVFRSPLLSRLFYPVLRSGRNALLKVLGRTRIKDSL